MPPIPPAGPDPHVRPAAGSAADARPAIQRAAEHLAGGRPTDAVEALTRLVAGAPTYAAATVLQAVALEAAGRPTEALAVWHRAAFLVPGSPLVRRERQRLMAAMPAPPTAAPEPVAASAAVDHPPGAVPTTEDVALERLTAQTLPDEAFRDEESQATEPVSTESVEETLLSVEPDSADGPLPDERSTRLPTDEALADDADFPALQTLPLGDLTLTGTPGDTDPDDFDPAGFDFSAFDLGDDDEVPDWLGASPPETLADGPPPQGTLDFAEVADTEPAASVWADDTAFALPPVTDWGEHGSDDAAHLMPPEGAGPAPTAPPEPEPAWAIYTDEPEASTTVSGIPPPETIPPDAPEAAVDAWPADVTSDEASDVGGLDADNPAAPPSVASSVADELDSLIASLEQAPRIRPDPAFDGPPVGRTAADVDEMASETLARIYAAQHQYVEAALVYEKLAAREPDRAAAMLEQAAEMRRRRG